MRFKNVLRFVEVWQAADSIEEVASTFSITHSSASGKAARLRRRGVELKDLRSNDQGTLKQLKAAAKAALK